MDATQIFDRYVIYFFVYAVAGWCGEVIYCSIPQKRFVNRGFLYGPYLPIYGFGGVVVHLAVSQSGVSFIPENNPLLVFLGTMVMASVIEYVGSWLLEKCFGVKLWDYSSHRFNINGRVCLLNSTIFGLAGLVLTYGGHRTFCSWIDRLSPVALEHGSRIILVGLTADFMASVFRMKAFRDGLEVLKSKAEAAKEDAALLRSLDTRMARDVVKARLIAEAEDAKQRLARRYSRFMAKFPSMTISRPGYEGMIAEMKKIAEKVKKNHGERESR